MAPHDAIAQSKLDMKNAREKATIPIENIRDYLYNGRDGWETHQRIVRLMSEDPVFDKSKRDFMTRTERYQRGLEMTNKMYFLREKHDWSVWELTTSLLLMDEPSAIALHTIAFEPVIQSQGSDEMAETYGALIANRGILGCYLQTELGHGSQVSRLETTATYIPSTREFEIHSPTLTSTKWWVGALGKTATHGVVQAQLILDGKSRGPHLFLVQLRSLDDHKLLPGIIAGDIGPKALGAFQALDNGFARFNRVRIPKSQMLEKFAKVSNEGNYIEPPHAKLSYGGMMFIRSTMITQGGLTMAKAATVALRYATVRRQGGAEPGDIERQIITYPSVSYRLLPILARSYVFVLLGRSLIGAFADMSSKLAKGDTSLLAEMHATTSALKVLVSTHTANDLEVARRSMGGHGFSAFAGLGRTYGDYLPATTYEGDNFVLDQQVVRAALKSFSKANSEATLSPSSAYLRLLLKSSPASFAPIPIKDVQWSDPAMSILLLEWRAALLVKEVSTGGIEVDASCNQRVSRAVAEAFVARQVGDLMKDLDGLLEGKEKQVVIRLYHLYLLITVESGLVDLLSYEQFSASGSTGSDVTRPLRKTIADVCNELLPNAIALSDAHGFTDWEIDSSLGVYDGDVYTSLWERAQLEPLNKDEVTPAYLEQIKPILERGQRLAKADAKL